MVQFRLHWWPIVTAIWMILTFITSYIVAVANDHVYALLPYISDTGSTPPESCVFGQMLNIAAVLMLVTVYIRYNTVKLIYASYPKKIQKCNKYSNICGVLACLGMSIVGNFQETSQMGMHLVGANLAFLIGAFYFIMQAYCSVSPYASTCLKTIRWSFSILLIPLNVVTTVCSIIATERIGRSQDEVTFHWDSSMESYGIHLAATVNEWLMGFVMIGYVVSFYVEFKLIQFEGITFSLKEDSSNSVKK